MSKSEPTPWRVRAGAIGLLLAVFVAGAATGVAGYRWLWFDARDIGRPPLPGEIEERLRYLELTREQRTRVNAVFESYRPQIDAVLRETFPRVRAVQEQIDGDIVKLLTAEQRRKFEESAKQFGPPPMGLRRGPDGRRPRGPRTFNDRDTVAQPSGLEMNTGVPAASTSAPAPAVSSSVP